MSSRDYARLYDAYYYAHDCGRPYQRDPHWLSFFGAIADQIVARIAPHTVLDAGCAMGLLVEALRQRGVECYGVDISEYAIARVHPDIRPFCWVGSITDPFPQRYDLIVCIEILEHMPAAESYKAIANLCQHTDDILFSSTPFDYKEVTHLNVQPPEHWAEMFAQYGFFRDVDFDASFILPWAVRFRRRKVSPSRLVREYERRFWHLCKENVDLRAQSLEMRGQIAEADQVRAEVEHTQTIAATFAQLRIECEWLRTQLSRQRRGGWVRTLFRIWQRLHSVRVLGGRIIKRLPPLRQQPVVQTFVAEGDNLCSVSILVENQPYPLSSPLYITLTAAGDPNCILLERVIRPYDIPVVGVLKLEFEPMGKTENQSYQLTVQAPNACASDTFYLWRYVRAGRRSGALQWGDCPLGGELVMSAAYGIPPNVVPDRWQPPLWAAASLFDLEALIKAVIKTWANG